MAAAGDRMLRLRRDVLVVGLVALAAGSGMAQASGFALRENSATGQGNAFAGATAAAEDISFMANNPAGLTRHPGDNFSATATAILPKGHFSKSRATLIGGSTTSGSAGGDDIGPDAVAPAIYFSHQASSDWFVGLSLTAPFGLVSKYDPTWVGRYHAIKSDISTIDFNPVAAYKVSPQLSVGGGVRIAYTRGILSNAVDFGTLDILQYSNANGGVAGANDGTAVSEGDDLALGYNFGVLYQIQPSTRIGAAYRSKLHTRLDGAADFNNSAVGNAISTSSGAFVRSGINAEVNLPESLSMGVHHDVSPRLALMAEASWTAWRRLEELRIRYDNSAQSDTVIKSNWKNSMFYAVGATYRANDRWTLRSGLAYDQTPVPDATRTPRVPDEDRLWVSFGARYEISPGSSFDFGYTHIFFREASVNLTTAADSNNNLRGNLKGHYDLSADIVAVQYRLQF